MSSLSIDIHSEIIGDAAVKMIGGMIWSNCGSLDN